MWTIVIVFYLVAHLQSSILCLPTPNDNIANSKYIMCFTANVHSHTEKLSFCPLLHCLPYSVPVPCNTIQLLSRLITPNGPILVSTLATEKYSVVPHVTPVCMSWSILSPMSGTFRTSEHLENAYLMEFLRLNYVTKYMWITRYSA